MKFILTGDLIVAAKVEVEADSKAEAIEKAAEGDFKVVEQFPPGAFELDGEGDEYVHQVP